MKTITKKAYGKNIKITDARDNFDLAINNAKGNTEQDGEPTPDVPIEIKSVVLSEIKSCGKNLLNLTTGITQTNKDVTLTFNNNKTISLSGTASADVSFRLFVGFNFKANQEYILSGCPSGGSGSKYFLYASGYSASFDYGNGANIEYTEDNTSDIYFLIKSGTNVNGLTIKPMISYDGGEFEPYTESVATLSNPITLNGLNGIWDDIKRGVLIKRFKEVVLSSSMNWKVMDASSTLGHNVYYTVLSDYNFRDGNSLNYMCTHLTAISHNERYKENTVFVGSNKWLVCCPKDYTTLDDWKAYLDSHEVYVTYELAEPIETPLPDADVEALKSLKTYDGVTHIFTDSEEVEPTLEVEYTLLEAKNEWNYTDYILHTDYNRIVSNINYLKAYLDSLFLGLTNISTMEEKTAKSLIYAREINAIETALEQLNLETYKFDIGETKEYLPNTRTLNFEDLNRIESAIFMLAKQMTSDKENLTRLAFRLGNQKGIRV